MIILVLNFGSSSAKSQLIETSAEMIAENRDRLLAKVRIERMGTPFSIIHCEIPGGRKIKISRPVYKPEEAFQAIIDTYNEHVGSRKIEGVGHRVVHGGERFYQSVLMTPPVVEEIEDCVDLAPLHNPHNLKGFYAARALLPGAQHVAVFDTAFHHTMEAKAHLYGLPYLYYQRYQIRRYGFHGTSHRYLSYRYAQIHGTRRSAFKLITCHLGNGCSLCAVDYGRSVETTMGFTPVEGLLMGTRCGDVDPVAVLHVIAHEEMNIQEIESMLNRHSGLYGVSGVSSDMQVLLEEAGKGNERAKLAVDMFCHRVVKAIGAYYAVLNGCDAIVFSGGIGENSPAIRAQICSSLTAMGVEMDDAANGAAVGTEGRITADTAKLPVWAIPTNEELLIARDTLRVIQGLPWPQ
ncbi:MAG: acetate kinase [Bryobacteraceae bacterium]|nr:acetate kinase [Bryobacteraceae bacterium]